MSHNLYVTKGNDPMHVIKKFNELARQLLSRLTCRRTLEWVHSCSSTGWPQTASFCSAIHACDGTAGQLRPRTFEAPMDIVRSVRW